VEKEGKKGEKKNDKESFNIERWSGENGDERKEGKFFG